MERIVVVYHITLHGERMSMLCGLLSLLSWVADAVYFYVNQDLCVVSLSSIARNYTLQEEEKLAAVVRNNY